jgi:hypothetical protein
LYVEAEAAIGVMVKSLRDRTDALLSQDLSVLLRYYDPRVFAALLRHLSASQLATLLAAGSRWAFPGRRGELHINFSRAAPMPENTLPFVLSPEQDAALTNAGEADAMVDLLLNQNNPQLLELSPPDQHERVCAAIATARTFGIDHLADQVAFCTLSLVLGADFHEQQPWAETISSVRAGRVPFSDAVAQIGEGEAA